MAGDGVGHPAKCLRYGSFMRDLRRGHVEGIYWGLFGLVLLLLIIAGLAWTNSEGIVKKIKEAEKEVERGCIRKDLQEKQNDLIKRQYMTVGITSICAILGTVSTIVEALSALALEYCHGEDLTQFYWAFWGLIEVGACIALIGLAVYHIYSLSDKDHPPWMIALGTPVLVIAGLGHLLVLGIRALFRRCMGRPATKPKERSRRISSASTLSLEQNPYGAHVMGFNSAGEPLIQFPNNDNRPTPPMGAELINFDPVSGAAIIKYPIARTLLEPKDGTTQIAALKKEIDKQEPIQKLQQSNSSSCSGAAAQCLCKE